MNIPGRGYIHRALPIQLMAKYLHESPLYVFFMYYKCYSKALKQLTYITFLMSKMLTENQVLKVISYVISAHGILSSLPFLPTEMHQLCHS